MPGLPGWRVAIELLHRTLGLVHACHFDDHSGLVLFAFQHFYFLHLSTRAEPRLQIALRHHFFRVMRVTRHVKAAGWQFRSRLPGHVIVLRWAHDHLPRHCRSCTIVAKIHCPHCPLRLPYRLELHKGGSLPWIKAYLVDAIAAPVREEPLEMSDIGGLWEVRDEEVGMPQWCIAHGD